MKKIDQTVIEDLGLNQRQPKNQAIPVRHCYHGYSDGGRTDVLFADDAAFKRAMNKLAVMTHEWDVLLLAYCLMDNHFHLILYGECENCKKFLTEYARRISISDASVSAREIVVSIKSLEDNAYLKTAICYVLRNPIVARLPYHPASYPYSSGFLLFSGDGSNPWCAPLWKRLSPETDGIRRIDHLTVRDRRRLTGSRKGIPGEWLVAGGVIFPGHYVSYELCEKLFGTTRGFSYYMSSCREADFEQNQGVFDHLSISDKEMRQYRDENIRLKFGVQGIRCLSAQQRGLLARQLKRDYHCSNKQLARLVHLCPEQIAVVTK